MTADDVAGPDARRRVDRRTALGAGVGLVLGAAGGGTAGVLAASGGTTTSTVPSPGEALMTEHGVLKRVLLAYRAMQETLSGTGTVPSGVLVDATQIVSDYIEGFHEGLEEAYVFPRVADREPALVRTLLVQHDRGRHLTAAIAAAAPDLGTAAVRRTVAAQLAAFVRMYEPHEAWEDTVVYPALRAATPARTLELLAERFADLENARYGDHALATMLARVDGIEEQLHIHDLAAFTPEPL